jgi:hypothetical protein
VVISEGVVGTILDVDPEARTVVEKKMIEHQRPQDRDAAAPLPSSGVMPSSSDGNNTSTARQFDVERSPILD